MTTTHNPSEPMLDQTKLAEVTTLHHGGHTPNADGRMCAMEAVAYIAGEPWSDSPQCTCPVIASFMRAWNDGLPDAERSALLLPLIPKVIGTRSTPEVEDRRSLMAADWLVRVHTPAWLRLAGLTSQAQSLERLPEITSMAQVPSIRGPLEAVRQDADAARSDAWYPAGGDPAEAAARSAAEAAAGAAAWAAARSAARDALAGTKRELQQSAVRLVERMCEVTE